MLVAGLGDLATGSGNGSILIISNPTVLIYGRPVAVVGDQVQVVGQFGPAVGPILSGHPTMLVNGRPVAIQGSSWIAGPYSGVITVITPLSINVI